MLRMGISPLACVTTPIILIKGLTVDDIKQHRQNRVEAAAAATEDGTGS